MLKFYFSFLFSIALNFAFAQDITVQAFDYNSETRDTMISFPEVDHNNWEKITMLYSMRCKDGLVSPPISGQTNVGCGEWDYSCNTYITDSTLVDSLYSVSPDFVISNFDGDEFPYSIEPTYSYYQTDLKDVQVLGLSNESIFQVNNVDSQSEVLSGSEQRKRISFELSSSDLIAAGMMAGDINALKMNIISGFGSYKNLKLELRNGIDGSKVCFAHSDWKEVFYNSVDLDVNNNTLVFFESFFWNGIDDLQLNISFDINESDIVLGTKNTIEANLAQSSDNKIWKSDGQALVRLNGDFSSLQEELTLSFWSKGYSNLPVNTYFIEGVDASDNRQLNVHLPWSNGQVYWDCGNDGNGYDRINKSATPDSYKENWTYWTFTKNTSTGEMLIYINGNIWHGGTGKFKAIDIETLVIGSSANGLTSYPGEIDDVKLWSRELSPGEILENYCGDAMVTHSDLLFHYDFNQSNESIIEDQSENGMDAVVEGTLYSYLDFSRNHNLYQSRENNVPVVELIQGDYDLSINAIYSIDSIKNASHQVDSYVLDGTTRVLGSSSIYYLAGDLPVYDEENNVIDNIFKAEDGVILIGELEHYTKSPMQFEIISFVTPYGINLDLGWEGETWAFDVSDYGPLLKGNKRLYMSRGGQWQEDMDIKFVFEEGTPTRNVNSIQQIWPVTSTGYQSILDDTRFEPRPLVKSSQDESVLIKTVVTGHGQEGEFIPRQHFVAVDGIPVPWQVWKECSRNPVYPQGGTWVYDRAGWCPGMASDQQIHDFTGIMQNDVPIEVDYGITAVAGNSRYIVSSQAVKYGPANFNYDAALQEIIYPSNKIEHGRFNPNCSQPRIVIQNRGAENLSSAIIRYGIEGGETYEQEWNGNLSFLAQEEIQLGYLSNMAASEDELTFFAEIINSNNQDEYESNNRLNSSYEPVDMLSDQVVINFKTNNNSVNNGYIVYDEYDQVIYSKGPAGLSANTVYYDTLSNLNGCYRFVFTDSGQDGLEFFC